MIKKENEPLFSVVIPVFNRTAELSRCLESISKQTEKNFEVIVIDDGSEELISEKIKKITERQDYDVRLIQYKENKNGAYARNQGIKSAKGNYICFLDSDDEWLNNKLEKCKKYIEVNPCIDFFFHRYLNRFNNVDSQALPNNPIKNGQTVAGYSFCTNKYGGIQSSCIVVSHTLAINILFNEKLKAHQDWDFALRATHKLNEIGFIPDALTIRNITPGNIGMVSRSVDYYYSYNFLKEYIKYFRLKEIASFSANILFKRRLITTPKPALNTYLILAFIYHPILVIKKYREHGVFLRRCKKLLKTLKQKNASKVAFYGYNNYSIFFADKNKEKLDFFYFIDKEKKCEDLKVYSPDVLEAKPYSDIDVIVLMTDLHYDSMLKDIPTSIDRNNIIKF